mmetsp:Transcript_57214/g.114711  ORF Transcript_57214/g.114711 Transcript_57214/m.114711 type:complete len:302 (+) Transcript_57214:690-1595(+)
METGVTVSQRDQICVIGGQSSPSGHSSAPSKRSSSATKKCSRGSASRRESTSLMDNGKEGNGNFTTRSWPKHAKPRSTLAICWSSPKMPAFVMCRTSTSSGLRICPRYSRKAPAQMNILQMLSRHGGPFALTPNSLKDRSLARRPPMAIMSSCARKWKPLKPTFSRSNVSARPAWLRSVLTTFIWSTPAMSMSSRTTGLSIWKSRNMTASSSCHCFRLPAKRRLRKAFISTSGSPGFTRESIRSKKAWQPSRSKSMTNDSTVASFAKNGPCLASNASSGLPSAPASAMRSVGAWAGVETNP